MEAQISSLMNDEFLAFQIGYITLFASTLVYMVYWFFNVSSLRIVGKIIYILGILALTTSIGFRYAHTGRLPLIQAYEVFLLMGWMMLLVGLFADKIVKNVFSTTFTSFFVAIAMVYIEGHMDRTAGEVMPALQSHWLEFHVITTMLSYAAISVGFLAAEAYLVSRLDWLEELSYKMTAFGFPLLTIGIVSGSVWAQEAWGTWWGWDPKETASLIMWLVFAAYLHMRLVGGWRGAKAAWMNIAGFASMLFCFLGLNWVSSIFKLESQHVYGTGGEGTSKMFYFLTMVLIIAVVVFIGGMILKIRKPKIEDSKDKGVNESNKRK